VLAGRVRGGSGHHGQSGPGPDVEHAAAAAFHHRRHQRRGQLHDRQDVRVQHPPGAIPVGLVEQPLVADAGVVHQDAHRPGLLMRLGHHAVDIALVGQVGRDDADPQPRVPGQQVGSQLFEPTGTPRDQDQGVDSVGEPDGKLSPDARGGAGYQHGGAIERRAQGVLHSVIIAAGPTPNLP
jgi:hypothetical protein